MQSHEKNNDFESNEQLMLHLKDAGYIRSDFIFDIMCSVDRKNFTTNPCTAYRDRPEVVAYEKTIAAPHMHAIVLEQMSGNLRGGKFALDIESRSGYLTICMALALGEKGKVIGIDCISDFQNMANEIVKSHYPELLENDRVEFLVRDGRRGWPWSGPYDAIHVGLAAANIPEILIEQLAPGGCLIMPVGLGGNQTLVCLKKSLSGIVQKTELMKVRYGTFTDIDLPWSSITKHSFIPKRKIESCNNALAPKSQNHSTAISVSSSKANIEKTIETIEKVEKAENQTLENIITNSNNIVENQSINLINDSFLGEKKTIQERVGIYLKKCDKFEMSTPQRNTTTKIESDLKNSDEIIDSVGADKDAQKIPEQWENDDRTSLTDIQLNQVRCDVINSMDTDQDVQKVSEQCKKRDETLNNIQLNQNVHDVSKLLCKSLENFARMNKPVSEVKPSSAALTESDKNKPKSIKEKIDMFERNIIDGTTFNLHENLCIKMKLSSDESENTISIDPNNDMKVLDEKSKRMNESLKNLQPPSSKTHDDFNEIMAQAMHRVTDHELEESDSINNIEKLCVAQSEPNQSSGDDRRKGCEKSPDSHFSELEMFKDEVRVLLDDFLTNEKEISERNKLREINININKVEQIQMMNNNALKQENNANNLEQTKESRENLDITLVADEKLGFGEQNRESINALQIEVRNLNEKFEKLEYQNDKNKEKEIRGNEKLQEYTVLHENLEQRLQRLERKSKFFTKILAKLMEKTKCYENILNIYLNISEKEETSRLLEKQIKEKTEEKINKLISIISRMNEQIKIIGCNFIYKPTESQDENSVERSSELNSETHLSNQESFTAELNLIKNLLHLGKKNPDIENDAPLKIESDVVDDENEMSLIKLLLEQ